ncbi:MAG: hypothetical protein A2887_02425 [Alphaproteobacteria bacterium RIFCSPLOWO2_01_FULL_40_26]|nr:MAG: hypothetical protein A3D15_03195 [Alphaproteobacteria bacterium RIFCSPHIGHO2_02_FULL_40_34]OFW88465.1 MAG: hypothetical protein A2794_04110 [Alphaproteobacteria bacterium RIFCSPHIGHO2_01_FULL_40_8]OFW94841.1 MAG: hypothetical protein A2887_02425 [Alphaproteobacteria bacterium RIFCSPLOWO2_01_FULL_40_26]OFX10467.1 MAG: hypothetical protein A3H30_03835 [Alphaproteobacteria bacterium RIFCSPLOWO2_02_FULL_40_19]OFX11041.1 MAG: hypothetical protein A3G22_01285 [Alphaproteobacteria bacterium RI
MKTSLPKRSQPHFYELKKITDIILEQAKNKVAFIILFGSFAKGSWVQDIYQEHGITYDYSSDYDLLIITKKYLNKKPEFELWRKIKAEIHRNHLDREHPTTLVIESIKRVNSKLEKAQYFFSDIIKEGILLYDSKEFELAKTKNIDKKEIEKLNKKEGNHWFNSAKGFLSDSTHAMSENRYAHAAFHLHQTTESFYHSFLLHKTGYKPKTHDLEELRKLCAVYSDEFLKIFPRISKPLDYEPHRLVQKKEIDRLYNSDNPEDWYKLLLLAYIEARYNIVYRIRKEQLLWLIEKIGKLQEIISKLNGKSK